MNFNNLNSINNAIANIKIPEPILPDYEDTVCGKIDKLQENIEKSNSTQKSQLEELEKIRYQNIKLNAQVETLNKLTDKQSDDISELKQKLNATQLELANFKSEYQTTNKNSFIKGVFVAFIPALIILTLTIIASKYGLL